MTSDADATNESITMARILRMIGALAVVALASIGVLSIYRDIVKNGGGPTPATLTAHKDCVERGATHRLGYRDGELIITGQGEAVERALQEANLLGRVEEHTVLFDFGHPVFSAIDLEFLAPYVDPRSSEPVTIALFRLDCETTTESALADIEDTPTARTGKVVAEPNQLLQKSSSHTGDTIGDPNDSVAPIDPNKVPGNLATLQQLATDQAQSARDQLANETIPFSLTQDRALVVIFDSYFDVQTGTRSVVGIDGSSFEIELSSLKPTIGTNGYNKREHGIFTAGIIHSMEHEADFILLQVLDEWGEGFVSDLTTALSGHLTSSSSTDLARSIYHLGLHVKPNSNVNTQSLQTALSSATGFGGVIVGASGNENVQVWNPPPLYPTPSPAFKPASFAGSPIQRMISVSARGNGKTFACYSTMHTPGNGFSLFGGFAWNGPNECKSQNAHQLCVSSANPAACMTDFVISLMVEQPSDADASDDDNIERLGLWLGTSFSAAFVTGYLASLMAP